MANRRMFSMQIVDTDAFLDMPASSQALYFHLSMRADDDGFVDSPKRIIKIVGANEDDIKILLTKRFLLPCDNGIVVIKHWKIHNYIAKDRYVETKYLDEKKKLFIKDNGSYTECIQDVCVGKVRLGKVSKDKDSITIKKENKDLALYLLGKVKENYSFIKDEVTDKDISEMDRLNRIDGYPYEVIKAVIDWATRDSFWKQNIRSVFKLRKQFATLLVKIKAEQSINGGRNYDESAR